jgi:hypothetical protein
MNNFRRHGVEDECEVPGSQSRERTDCAEGEEVEGIDASRPLFEELPSG